MFDYDIMETKHFTRKADGEQSYRNWLQSIGVSHEDFPFTVKTGRMFKGKPINFHIVSWGAYIGASGEWLVFVAYRFNAMKHTVQYTWKSIVNGEVMGDPTKNEWIGG